MISEIIDRKIKDVEGREKTVPLSTFAGELRPSDRSLEKALGQPQTGFVLECKKASPSRGLIRHDFDVNKIAQEYAPFADAISVITDEPFFQGHLNFIAQVRNVVDCPVLCKDFVVSTYQIYEARRFGADAVLLMLSVLDDVRFEQCFAAAKQLSMDVLVEVHNEAELERALRLGAKIIGVNNRDFTTLKVDLNVSRRLIPNIPKDKILVLESGIFKHEEVIEFRDQVAAFLVGTSLMEKPRIDLAVRELIFGRVKVCGQTSTQDAHMAYESGAVFGGLIFAKESPRCVDEQAAHKIVSSTPLQWVGVFVNDSIERIAKLAQELALFAVQLHGEEDAAYINQLRMTLPQRVEIWKAVRVRNQIPTRQEFGADRLLLDSYRSDRRGGTGETFDWSLLEDYSERDHIILSGGVSPQNAREADRMGVWALDVNSKVEIEPGRKSREKLRELFVALRGIRS